MNPEMSSVRVIVHVPTSDVIILVKAYYDSLDTYYRAIAS